jgi:hypothetical protein
VFALRLSEGQIVLFYQEVNSFGLCLSLLIWCSRKCLFLMGHLGIVK